MDTDALLRNLRQEILFARRRVYAVGEPTPLQPIDLEAIGARLWIKREDLSPIHAYKWRGAYNRMACLDPADLEKGVVTASAGNHAQGVALAARRLGTRAVIYMPASTPRMKQLAVDRHGGAHVDVRLTADTYDAASRAAHEYAEESGATYIHAYDDLAVMAGQGTLADEIVMSGTGVFDHAFLQIGGGGMAAATAAWLKFNFPGIRITGVEGVDQASMAAAVAHGEPVSLDRVDVFCDGTAVRKVGRLTHAVCAALIDDWMTVTNDEVAAAIQFLWERLRCIAEPSGAMGVAAMLRQGEQLRGKRCLGVLCGANIDFEQLATIAHRAAVGSARRRFLRISIGERPGSMLALLDALPETVNIVDFQYGKTHPEQAFPVIGFEVEAMAFDMLRQALRSGGFSFTEVTAEPDVAFRIIHYEPTLMRRPFFIQLEFHERAGALGDFLRAVSPHANLAYFNYEYSGERVGRALLGFEFASDEARAAFADVLRSAEAAYRDYQPLPDDVVRRILG